MRIGIIGAGRVGTTLGKGWSKAGHDVVYGVRAQDAAPAVAGSRVASVREATTGSELVVLATPWAAVASALDAAGDLGGKPLLDVTNPIGPGFTLALAHSTSGAEHVASLAKNARVVKAFNTTGMENMAGPGYGGRRLVMPVAGDDREATDVAARLAGDLGFEAVRLGGLVRARDLEPVGLLWIKLALEWGHGRGIGFAISRRAPDERSSSAKKSARPKAITVVGSGNIGGALARAWRQAGHDVRVAVRDESATDVRALAELGVKPRPVAGAAAGADVVVLAIPAAAVKQTVLSLGDLEGKVVVDCTNAIGKGFTLQYGGATSSPEELAKACPGAKIARSFNQQGSEVLESPLFGGLRATNFVASDSEEACALVHELSDDVGLESVDAGPLASSRLLDHLTVLWVSMSQAVGTRDFGLSLLRR